MNVDDLIQLPDKTFVRYSDLVKNSVNIESNGYFMTVIYDKNGNITTMLKSHKNIFRAKAVLKYTKKFNPEKLI